MSRYAFHPDAFADLDEIWEYIAKDNLDAADRVLSDVHSTLATLAASPEIGHLRPDLTTRPLRFHVVRGEYLIAYGLRNDRSGLSLCFTVVEIRDSWQLFFADGSSTWQRWFDGSPRARRLGDRAAWRQSEGWRVEHQQNRITTICELAL
jgi:plasmid stabilization system protein ParE